jgi:hypothetical protein
MYTLISKPWWLRGKVMLYDQECKFTTDDVEEWMWDQSRDRPGYWKITIPYKSELGLPSSDKIRHHIVCYSQKEYALLDKVVTNQIYGESKAKIYRTVVFQRGLNLWDTGSDDDVAMRTLGAWAVAQYKCQPEKFYGLPWRRYAFAIGGLAWSFLGAWKQFKQMKTTYEVLNWAAFACCPVDNFVVTEPLFCKPRLPAYEIAMNCLPTFCWLAVGTAWWTYFTFGFNDTKVFRVTLTKNEDIETPSTSVMEEKPDQDDKSSKKNKLGYQEEGEDYVNEHPGGGVDDADSEIRATVDGRIVKKDCGIGIVGQSVNDKGAKQFCGVLSLPVSVEPNVYAQELKNAIKAIEERIDKKQRPYAGTAEDKLKIGRFVNSAINGRKFAPFSAKKVMDYLHGLITEEIRSKKWTEDRITNTIETLCQEIDPSFKLKAACKLEGMPEGKAPRLLIADEDRGQVMALLTIHCMEGLQKKHFPEQGIKGLAKKDAVKRVMKACRAPKKAAKQGTTVFEGDGSAWDTTCSAEIRNIVENPIIKHIAKFVELFVYATPDTWAKAHTDICEAEKLALVYSKNKEFQKIIIKAIRRSGHRGTSCCNWWVNRTCWYCAIFEDPEEFLDPARRYGKDVTGINRWLNSAYEGDDSFLNTAPKIEAGQPLHTVILQFWERIGFNMKIEIRDKRALFVGYYIGIDEYGPVFNEEKDEYMMVPEIDRCFGRAGTSCSASMIQAFKDDNKAGCLQLSGAAAMSRAYEFAGLCPTISEKFLKYALQCNFVMTHDLKMRIGEDINNEDKNELADHIHAANACCSIEDKILLSTGFWMSDEEKAKFQDYVWDYDRLDCWKEFRDSLPQSWRA